MKNLLLSGLSSYFASSTRQSRRPRSKWQWVGLVLLSASIRLASAQTTTFQYKGDTQNFTVPAGVTCIQVIANGASGGRYYDLNTPNSPGAQVTATLSVTPGEVLFVVVGGQGVVGNNYTYVSAGGYNGGGSGSGSAGGGGGATELRRARVFATTDDYLSARNAVVVAGASGGNDGATAVGGAGGTPTGGDGIKNNNGIGGGGATQSAVGGSGELAGKNNQGGSGHSGGGGGGGYYGGGGGYPTSGSAGGGGGSSWVTAMGSSDISYGLAPTTGNGSLSITVVAAPLPVHLGTFTAEMTSTNAVRLAWTTVSETNSARFEVERSVDGLAFSLIGQVPAAGTSAQTRTYSLTDMELPTEATRLYYRLRQVDTDETASYSPVRTVVLTPSTLALYPNPAHHAATLSGATPGALVQVYDARGSLVLTTQANIAGSAALVLPARLAGGLYWVRSGTGPALRLSVE